MALQGVEILHNGCCFPAPFGQAIWGFSLGNMKKKWGRTGAGAGALS